MVDEQVTGELSHDPWSGRPASELPELPELPEPPITGDTAVDDAVARLADLRLLPLDDHPAVYDEVHRTLTDRLADVEG